MTALTTQQMQELANKHLRTSAAIDLHMVAALRTAADHPVRWNGSNGLAVFADAARRLNEGHTSPQEGGHV